MLRLVLFIVLAILVTRAFWRLVDGVIEGATGRPAGSAPPAVRMQMVRDPVCGTYVLPDRAVALVEANRRLFFCSTACRDAYRARRSTA